MTLPYNSPINKQHSLSINQQGENNMFSFGNKDNFHRQDNYMKSQAEKVVNYIFDVTAFNGGGLSCTYKHVLDIFNSFDNEDDYEMHEFKSEILLKVIEELTFTGFNYEDEKSVVFFSAGVVKGYIKTDGKGDRFFEKNGSSIKNKFLKNMIQDELDEYNGTTENNYSQQAA